MSEPTRNVHPSPERAAAALESAGLNPYLLMEPDAIAATQYPEIRVGAAANRFTLLSLEDLPVPLLRPEQQDALERVALDLASRWGLTWRGRVENGRVEVAFGGDVRYLLADDPDEAGLRLHEAILAVHHAHQSLRQRAVHLAWRAPPPLSAISPATA